jgi:4'-phosphopantetheinyl transferase
MPAPHQPGTLPDCHVHVWEIALDIGGDTLCDSAAVLSAGELGRAARYVFERDRRRFIACRAAVRRILGLYTERDPRELAFEISPYGKPRVCDAGQLQFNVSHSGDLALCAVARTDIGIDLEYVRPLDDMLQLAERCFSAEEARAIRDTPPPERVPAFYRCWTRKEAYVKACGQGLSIGLSSFSVSVEADRPRLVFSGRGDTDHWELQNIPTRCRGYIAAIAISTWSLGGSPVCRRYRWHPAVRVGDRPTIHFVTGNDIERHRTEVFTW